MLPNMGPHFDAYRAPLAESIPVAAADARAAVETLALNQAKGAGPTTTNHYIRAVTGFTRWMVKAKRIGSDPLDTLESLNEAVDVAGRGGN
jgi:hypothetical protein